MSLSRVSIARPVTVAMCFIGLAMIGLFAAFRLPIEQFPEVEIPYVGLGIPWGNATPREVERNVTRPVEEVLSTMSGIERMFTFTRPGYVFVNLSLEFDDDVTGKSIEAKELVESIRHRLPDDIRHIQLRQQDPNETPVMNVLISAPDLDEDAAFELLDTHVRAPLERIGGVNSAVLYGIVEDTIRVELDPGRVAAYGLDYLDVQRRLQTENFFASAGTIDTGSGEILVRPLGRFETLEAIRGLPMNDAGLILDDIADVVRVPDDDENRRRVNGQRSLGVSVYKRPEANLVQVSRDIDRRMRDIQQSDSFRDVRFYPLDDQADTVLQSLNDLRDSGFLGGILSVLVLFGFLRRASVSILIAATVPLALCATLGLMYFLDMTLNILSVVGLMLAIGLLVDNSVVASEAIAQRRREGDDAITAAERGISDVGLAITAGTLTTVIVFVPSFMTSVQQVAIVQQNIAVPLCTALLGSLLVAQTLVPSIMARIPVDAVPRPTPLLDRLTSAYERVIVRVLRYRWVSLVGAVLIGAAGVPIYQQLDVDMNPDEESPRLQLNYYVRGSMDIDYIERFVQEVDDYLMTNRERFEIDNIFTSYDTDSGRTIINLLENGSLAPGKVEEMIMADIPELPNIRLRFSSQRRGFGGGGRGGLGIRLIGDSTEALIEIGDELVAVLEGHPNLVNVRHDGESSRQEIRIRLKPEQAGQLGVSARDVAQVVSIALGGRSLRRGLVEGGRELEIMMELEGRQEADLDTLRTLPVFIEGGETVPLEAVATIEFASSIRVIRRENRETSININFSTRRGPPAMAQFIAEDVMNKFELPPGYRWELGQAFERDAEMFREMLINGLLAIALVYLLMAALFESVLFPTVVVASIGYSIVGALLSLWVTGTTLTAMALTGMLLLGGIVVNNAIVLLNRIQQLRREGEDRIAAIVDSGRQRLRPILMTVCTTFMAMLPLAVGDVRVGGVGPSYFPMARALIGGLAFSTIVTLLVTPLLYLLLDDLKQGAGRLWNAARREAAGASAGR